MRKGWIVLLACALVAALALPAAADVQLNGFYRAKGYVSNFKNAGAALTTPSFDNGDKVTNAYVEQRMRLRFSVGDENVKAVSFFELDSNWGDTTGIVNRNQGSALNADSINIETKNVFVWFKIPSTPVDVTVGLQNQSDSYAGVFFGLSDFAGIFANAKIDPVALRFGYGKWFENNLAKADDTDLYIVEAKLAPTKDIKVGLNLYYLNDLNDTSSPATGTAKLKLGGAFPGAANGLLATDNQFTTKMWMPGVDVTLGAGPATISAFAFYQFGKIEFDNTAKSKIDIRGWAADARADLSLGPGKLFAETIYASGDDSISDNKFGGIVTASDFINGQAFYARTDMQLLLCNIDDINTLQSLANTENGGRGLWHLAAGYNMKLMDKLSFKVGAGYAQVAKKRTTDQGKVLGTEVNGNVNFNLQKGLDFGLYGAYVFLGDFFDVTSGPDRVNPYDLHFRVNYAF